MVNDATVGDPDILASNGIIHVIDKVLLPPADEEDDAPSAAPTEDEDSGAAGTSATGLVIGALAGAAALLF